MESKPGVFGDRKKYCEAECSNEESRMPGGE